MINDKDKQEEHRRSMHVEREELQQAAKCLIRSMFRTGVSLAFVPVNRLPPKPQQHFRAAGREFAHGLATLIYGLAEGIEERAKDTGTSTNYAEGADGELE